MKNFKKKIYTIFLILSILFTLNSCQKPFDQFFDEQFPEANNLSSEMIIDGEVAVPLLNTYFSLTNFLPTSTGDSSFWIEIDNDKLIHLKMYYKNVFSITPTDMGLGTIFPGPVSKDSITFNTDSNSLAAFNNMFEGQLFFTDPKISLIFFNEMPLNLFFRLDSLNFISDAGLQKMGQTTKHYITKAGTSTTETRVNFDKNSEGLSSFSDMFSPIPHDFNIKITAGLDKDTTYSGDGNEKLQMDVEIDLPIDIRLEDLVMGDTLPFNIDSADSPITGLTLKIFFDNEFPFSGNTQISFADTSATGEADQIILKLFDNTGWKFESATTNTAGETISSTKSNVTVELSEEQLDSLKQFHASKLIIASTLNTYNSSSSQDVKIFTFYKLGIKIGVKVDYSLNVLQ